MVIDKNNKEVKKDFLTPEEREEISDIINLEVRFMVNLYNKEGETRLNAIYDELYNDNGEGYSNVKSFIKYNKHVARIKEIFAGIKKRAEGEEEKRQVKLLEANVLEIIEKMTQGIDYWEDTEHYYWKAQQESLKEYITSILWGYLTRELQNNFYETQLNNELKVKVKEGTKPSSLRNQVEDSETSYILNEAEWEKSHDLFWIKGQPKELLVEVENGELKEVVIKIIEKWETDAVAHLDANKKSQEGPWSKEFLRKEVMENKKKLEGAKGEIEKYEAQVKQLRKELEEQAKKLENTKRELEKKEQQNKELQRQIEEQNKRKVLKRKLNSTQQEGGKKRIKLQQSVKRRESQKLIANIEVPTKYNN